MRALLWLFVAVVLAGSAVAHEGHDHDKPAPLSLPIAPRVVAVTPDYELVGIRSGSSRLTIFLTSFATNEPVLGASLSVEADGQQILAEPKDAGMFEASAPFFGSSSGADLVFSLTLADGSQDLLTGRLDPPALVGAQVPAAEGNGRHDLNIGLFALGGLVAGAVLTLLLQARRRRTSTSLAPANDTVDPPGEKVRRVAALMLVVFAIGLIGNSARAAEPFPVPSIPSSMATDLAQRLPDGTLFVPKATQHLLAVRTILAMEQDIARSVELTGTVVPSPNGFGRVQSAHSGRLEAPEQGLGYIGQKVSKGDLLGYLSPHIGTVERGTVQSQIAETDARIEMQKARLVRLHGAKLAVPPIKIDEAEGELAALQERRRELNPTLTERHEIRAPVSGVVSKAGFYAGQVIDPRDVLFEIVDPSEFWIEAAAYDPSLEAESGTATAMLASGKVMPLAYAGRGLALREQTAPIMFRVKDMPEPIAVGQPVKVFVSGKAAGKGFVVPSASIVRGANGLPTVWVKADAERFEPLLVHTVPLDGQNVVITEGIKADMRVVTDGVTLLNQVR